MKSASSNRRTYLACLAVHCGLAPAKDADSFLLSEMSEGERGVLESLAQFHLARHGDDPALGLEALRGTAANSSRLINRIQSDSSETHIVPSPSLQNSDTDQTRTFVSGSPIDQSHSEWRPTDSVRYEIIRPHAKGGLGEVFVARDRELNRDVALKEMQAKCLGDVGSRARFVLEAEVTGGLEHPGIVPVYGAGKHQDGRPFYAMRFIRGESLKSAIDEFHAAAAGDSGAESSEFAGRPRMGTLEFRQLLGRFVDVCNAIDYAHSRGVLHRDLKPANIMLGRFGETLVVDWGLAKLADGEPEAATSGRLVVGADAQCADTRAGSAIGTPAYMPPEQAAGNLEDLSPASDVYALGATLFHLLTGRVAFTSKNVLQTLNDVRDGKFPKPREILAEIPASLEAVCLKAMSRSPTDRYASARDLADDIERWLADESVSVHRESLPMRVQRWTRKHPRLVSSISATVMVGVVCLATVIGIVTNKNEALANSNHDLAIAEADAVKQRNEALDAKSAADEARLEAEAATDYVVDAFSLADPSRNGRTVTVAEVIDRGRDRLETQADEMRPTLKAKLLFVLGCTYEGIGLTRDAASLHEEALRIVSDVRGANHEDVHKVRHELARDYQSLGELDKANELLTGTLRWRQQNLGAGHQQSLLTQGLLGWNKKLQGDYDAAAKLLSDALELSRKNLGDHHAGTLIALNRLASMRQAQGRNAEAQRLLEDAVERIKSNDQGHDLAADTMHNLAMACMRNGDLPRAISIMDYVVAREQKIYGERHPDTLGSLSMQAMMYKKAGRIKEALPMYEKAFAGLSSVKGVDHIA